MEAASSRSSTRHKGATLVFFDRLIALWTFFCVCFDPFRVCGFVRVLNLPFLNYFALTRLVTLSWALQARHLETEALYEPQRRVGIYQKAVLAAFPTAPSYLLVLFCELSKQQSPILSRNVLVTLEEVQEIRVANLHVAPLLHASRLAAVSFSLNLFS